MFRKSLAARVGPFDATNAYVVDLDYWFRLLLKGDAHYFPEPLAAFRVTSGSWERGNRKRSKRGFFASLSREVR